MIKILYAVSAAIALVSFLGFAHAFLTRRDNTSTYEQLQLWEVPP